MAGGGGGGVRSGVRVVLSVRWCVCSDSSKADGMGTWFLRRRPYSSTTWSSTTFSLRLYKISRASTSSTTSSMIPRNIDSIKPTTPTQRRPHNAGKTEVEWSMTQWSSHCQHWKSGSHWKSQEDGRHVSCVCGRRMAAEAADGFEIPFSALTLGKELGAGFFGVVYKGEYLSTTVRWR